MNNLKNFGGYAAGIVAGIFCFVAAFMFRKPAFAVWGAIFIVVTVISYIGGATATPGGSLNPSVKATFKGIATPMTFVLFGLVAIGILMTMILPPWK